MSTLGTLSGEHAVVTGGSRGIGAAISHRMASAGASVTVVYRERGDAARLFIETLPGPGQHTAVACDLSQQPQLEHLCGLLGDVSILVNNAGRIHRPDDWSSVTHESITATFADHVTAPILLIQAVAPHMKARGHGRIVNILSTYAIKGSSAVIAYTAAKSALATATSAMARELGQHGITVNAVAPGNIDTDMTQSAGSDVIDWAISTTPAGRLGLPDEVADAVEYLIGSPFVTGATIPVDGGQRLEI